MKRYLCTFTIFLIVVIIGLYKIGIVFYEYRGPHEGIFEATIHEIGKETKYMKTYTASNEQGKFLVYIKKNEKRLNIGDTIKFQGKYSKPAKKRNDGGFDYSLYLKTKKIRGSFFVQKVEKVWKSNNLYYRYKQLIWNFKQSIKKSAEKIIKGDNLALYNGILIGDTENMSDNMEENFRKSSLTHVLAISGSNFAYIILTLNYVIKIGKKKRLGQIITILCILLFMELTGNTASVLRAGIMSIMIILASITHRKYDLWTSIAVSVLVQIAYNPYCIFDLGLILSYGGVGGLALFYNKLEKKIKPKLVRATVSANLLIIPVLMYNFNTFSLTFIISNFLTTIIIEIITIVGIISIFLRIDILYIILNFLITSLNYIVNICAKIPFAEVHVITPSLFSILCYYLILAIVYQKHKVKKINKKIAILILMIIISNINFQVINIIITNDVLINFVDVGQGDCTLIRKNNIVILIDGGGNSEGEYDIGKNVLIPYLLYKKINRIDKIIVSHFDTDHVRRNFNFNE